MSSWTMHIDPWNIRASDLALMMQNLEDRFRNEKGIRKYTIGKNPDDGNIILSYENGSFHFWLVNFEDEDMATVFAEMSKYDLRLMEIDEEDCGFHKEFHIYSVKPEDHPLEWLAVDVKEHFMTETNDMHEAFVWAWEQMKDNIGYNAFLKEVESDGE